MHLLISNIAQVILLLVALAFKDASGNSVFPLSPLEILWANLVTSSFLALGLGLEEAQPDIPFLAQLGRPLELLAACCRRPGEEVLNAVECTHLAQINISD